MPLKGATAQKRRTNLYIFCVIALSVTIVAVIAAMVLSRISSSQRGLNLSKKAIAGLSGGFSCTADVTVNSKEYEVKLDKPKSGDSTMTFLKPAALKPLSFTKGSNGFKVKIGDLEADVDADSIPQFFVFNVMAGAFDTCISKSVNVKNQGADTALTGSSSAGSFTIVFDSGMKPKSLSVPSLKLTAKFKDFKYL